MRATTLFSTEICATWRAITLAALTAVLAVVQPAKAAFRLTGPLTTPRDSHTATLLPNGKVLVAGGRNGAGVGLSSAELYDPATGTWAATGPLSSARYGHTATLLRNGLILVAGGMTEDGGGYRSSAELFDPATGVWRATGSLITARALHTATLLDDGSVLIAGGEDDSDVLDSAELYDPATGQWTTTGSMTYTREEHTATLLPNSQVLVAGRWASGLGPGPSELYNPGTGTWTWIFTGNLRFPRVAPTATLLPNGLVMLAGGYWHNPLQGTIAIASAELYDPATGEWEWTASMVITNWAGDVSGTFSHTATLLTNGRVLVVGGAGSSAYPWGGYTIASAEVYDPDTETWEFAGRMTTPRAAHTATLLANGKVLLAGGWGYDFNTKLSSAELYDAATTLPPTPPVLTDFRKLAGGAFHFSFTNVAGAGFTVLAATNSALSVSNWTALGSVTEISPGQFQFTDLSAPNYPRRFYRVRSP